MSRIMPPGMWPQRRYTALLVTLRYTASQTSFCVTRSLHHFDSNKSCVYWDISIDHIILHRFVCSCTLIVVIANIDSLPFDITRRWPTPPLHKNHGHAIDIDLGVRGKGLRRPGYRSTNRFFRNFWSHGSQNRCIWSKISRGNWFWRLKLSIPLKIQEKWRKTDFRNPKK